MEKSWVCQFLFFLSPASSSSSSFFVRVNFVSIFKRVTRKHYTYLFIWMCIYIIDCTNYIAWYECYREFSARLHTGRLYIFWLVPKFMWRCHHIVVCPYRTWSAVIENKRNEDIRFSWSIMLIDQRALFSNFLYLLNIVLLDQQQNHDLELHFQSNIYVQRVKSETAIDRRALLESLFFVKKSLWHSNRSLLLGIFFKWNYHHKKDTYQVQ